MNPVLTVKISRVYQSAYKCTQVWPIVKQSHIPFAAISRIPVPMAYKKAIANITEFLQGSLVFLYFKMQKGHFQMEDFDCQGKCD